MNGLVSGRLRLDRRGFIFELMNVHKLLDSHQFESTDVVPQSFDAVMTSAMTHDWLVV